MVHLGPFLPKYGKIKIIQKIPVFHFLAIMKNPIFMQKFRKSENSEKSNERFLRKTSNGHTDMWTDQQTDKGEAIKPPVKSSGPKKTTTTR